MKEEDYIQLQTLLAKLEVAIAKTYKDSNVMTVKTNQRLQALGQGINTIRKNIFLKV